MGGAYSTYCGEEKYIHSFGQKKPEGKRRLGRPRLMGG